MQITPTLNFSGQCREAIQTYAKAFGGEITCQMTYREANDPAYTAHRTESQLDSIYHAELLLDGQRIILCDNYDVPAIPCYSNFLTLMFDTAAEVHRAYEAICEGAQIIYPLQETWYSTARVVLVDRFGIRWGLMAEKR